MAADCLLGGYALYEKSNRRGNHGILYIAGRLREKVCGRQGGSTLSWSNFHTNLGWWLYSPGEEGCRP